MKFSPLSLLPLLGLLALPVSASAQDTFTSLRNLAMGEAFVGGGTGSGAVFANPAGMAMASLYAIETGYIYLPSLDTHGLGFSIADSKTNPAVAGGGSFSYDIANGALESESDDVRGMDARVVTAVPLIPGQLAMGLTAHYLRHRYNALGAEDEDEDGQLDIVESRVSGYTGDIGIMFAPIRQLLMGVSSRNLFTVEGASLEREVDAGVGGYIQSLHVEASWTYGVESELNTFAVGVEYGAGSVPLRLGYRTGVTDSVSAGLGWRSTTGGFDLAYVKDLTHDNDRFGVSASFYL